MRMRSLMTALLAGGLLFGCSAEDGVDGLAGAVGDQGTQGPVGDQGADGDKGAAGDQGVKGATGDAGMAGECDEAGALEITGVTGLPDLVFVGADSPAFTIEVQHEGGAAATGLTATYFSDGPELVEGASATTFTISPEEEGTYSYSVYVTDGCTFDTVEFEIEAAFFQGNVSIVHLAPGIVGTVEVRVGDVALAVVPPEAALEHLPIPVDTVTFGLWDADDAAATAPIATTPEVSLNHGDFKTIVIHGDGSGGAAFTVLTDDLTPVAEPDDHIRLQAFHAIAGAGAVDITDNNDNDALVFDNLAFRQLSSESPELMAGAMSLGIDLDQNGTADYTFNFATGEDDANVIWDGEIGTAFVYMKGIFPALFLRSAQPDVGSVAGAAVTVDPSGITPDTTQTGTSAPNLDIDPAEGGLSGNPSTVSDDIAITGCDTVVTVEVDLDVVHDWRGDLVMSLTSPGGTEVLLTVADGSDNADDYVGLFKDGASADATNPTEYEPVQPLGDFLGTAGTGTWTLTITDVWGDSTGNNDNWNSWGLTIGCLSDS